jgi:phage/plasmid primase-like uncharacterized protein
MVPDGITRQHAALSAQQAKENTQAANGIVTRVSCNKDDLILAIASFHKIRFNPVKPSGYCTHRQFNIQQFYALPTQCVYVFCVDLRTNSDYFPIQH